MNNATKSSTPAEMDRFFDLSVELLCITSLAGEIRRANPAWERTLGIPAADVPGQALQDFIHPQDWDAVAARLEKLRSRRLPEVFECRCRTQDGAWRWLEWNVASVPDEQLLYASARDITDRKRAEKEIQKLAAFPRMSPNAVFEFAPDGELTYFNDAANELAHALGQPHPASILPKGTAEVVRTCLKRRENHQRVEAAAGDRTLAWTFYPLPASEVVHAYACDITERRRAEERIHEQAALLDKAQDAIIVRDLEHRILYWNKSAERLFGWAAPDALGRNAFELLSARQGEACLDALRHVLDSGEWSGELSHATKAGSEIIVESRWTLVRDESGRPKSILALSTDVTEKKHLETQFLRAQRLESVGTLASGIAHDLNNILAPIMMSVSLLQESLTCEHDCRLLETVRLSALRGAEMTRQILTFTRGKRGERGVVNLKHLVSEVAKIARQTFPPSIRVETDCAKELWPALADATQIHQVLMNLAVNARDAMLPLGHEGRLTICLQNAQLTAEEIPLHPEAKPGRYLRLTVSDTGIGIAPENIGKIWEQFFSLKSAGQGTGIGLHTVLTIVRNHGGFVHVESEPGNGSCFDIYLPASDAAANVAETERATPIPPGRGETILVIDDEHAFQELTRAIFNKYGYRVITAGDGAEALALFAQRHRNIDLVVTDMIMPCVDGPATIRGLHRIKPGLPIIATSGLSDNEAALKEFSRTTFLLKPFTAETLLHAVTRSLQVPAAAPLQSP